MKNQAPAILPSPDLDTQWQRAHKRVARDIQDAKRSLVIELERIERNARIAREALLLSEPRLDGTAIRSLMDAGDLGRCMRDLENARGRADLLNDLAVEPTAPTIHI